MKVNKVLKIGSSIKRLRKVKGYKQKDIANFLHIPLSTYSNYESNIRELSYETLLKIASLLDVSIDELIGRQPYSLENVSDQELIYELSRRLKEVE